jgi:hypothetical protein
MFWRVDGMLRGRESKVGVRDKQIGDQNIQRSPTRTPQAESLLGPTHAKLALPPHCSSMAHNRCLGHTLDRGCAPPPEETWMAQTIPNGGSPPRYDLSPYVPNLGCVVLPRDATHPPINHVRCPASLPEFTMPPSLEMDLVVVSCTTSRWDGIRSH